MWELPRVLIQRLSSHLIAGSKTMLSSCRRNKDHLVLCSFNSSFSIFCIFKCRLWAQGACPVQYMFGTLSPQREGIWGFQIFIQISIQYSHREDALLSFLCSFPQFFLEVRGAKTFTLSLCFLFSNIYTWSRRSYLRAATIWSGCLAVDSCIGKLQSITYCPPAKYKATGSCSIMANFSLTPRLKCHSLKWELPSSWTSFHPCFHYLEEQLFCSIMSWWHLICSCWEYYEQSG